MSGLHSTAVEYIPFSPLIYQVSSHYLCLVQKKTILDALLSELSILLNSDWLFLISPIIENPNRYMPLGFLSPFSMHY
jgi:hypothetical protein